MLHRLNSSAANQVPKGQVPDGFTDWFAAQGWALRDYQRHMISAYKARQNTLLIAPTGGGKTLAGFLPSLIELSGKDKAQKPALHTLYISPLRALTNDIERNLTRPVADMDLPITIGVRTGDTKQYQRQKQRKIPPDILLTTPESLMLLLSYENAEQYFASLKCVIIDELHSFATNKRGDFTSLALARLKTLAPDHIRFGLSATVAHPKKAAQWLGVSGEAATIHEVISAAKPDITIIEPETRFPLGGHSPRFATQDIYRAIKSARSVIVFVNTRAQAELLFQHLWQVNEDNLPIGVYHGSLSRDRRQKTEAMIASGKLRAVVSTSALEMGIDWGDVDMILQVGAPKGVSRLLQRIGRSNHRLDEPSRALMVPTNPLEAVECDVAIKAIAAGKRDGEDYRPGGMDVVVQYIVNRACAGKVKPRELLAEIRSASPYAHLTKADFDKLLSFAEDGGYALKTYERFHRLKSSSRGYSIASPAQARRHRMNIGTIVEYAKLKVRRITSPKSKRGRIIGEIEERFVMNLTPGDTFIFAGEVLAYQGIRDMALNASPAPRKKPQVPAYSGGMMPLSSYLADGVRASVANREKWRDLPEQIRDWLYLQSEFSALPAPTGVLVEAFFDRNDHVMVVHTFEGRKVNQALGFLLSKRMEREGLKPLTFSITDYALTLTSLEPVNEVRSLLSPDILDNDLNEWITNSPMVKRSFRKIATIAGLTEQRLPGAQRSMKQVTFSTDLIYDVLLKYEPDHILLRIAREEAENDLLDIPRLRDWLLEIDGQITFKVLPHASPLSIPSMMQLGKEQIRGEADKAILQSLDGGGAGMVMLDNVRRSVANG
ncbi:ligase-associated DNA damage response DEXH box helicase [Robiginitomaculum antarcticum]|uniref:ligase-associated DNA damage response DEXH box helicase n=1 Tax=Robiginitomaculum antarcticum TaxID=437507 RepID=UPI000373D8B9|nr:ligase-associated DNA damage response DEXH box helicase [Robiginitomaculum antarcticum]